MGATPLLVVTKDGAQIKSCPVQGEAVLGRAEGCVIRLDDRAVSRQHAVFKQTAEGFHVEKKSEFAPLSVNGKDCARAVLKDGDVISIGPYLVKLSMKVESQKVAVAPILAPALAPAPEDVILPVQSDEPAAEAVVVPVTEAPDANKPTAAEAPLSLDTPDEAAFPHSGELPQISLGGGGERQSGLIGSPDGPVDIGMVEIAESDAMTKVAPLGKVAVRLIFKPGEANVETFEFAGEEMSLGRAKSCDVVLNDKRASRKNTIIRKAGLNFVIKDLASSNGTYVNGLKIEEQELSGDDLIRIGDVEFRFVVASTDYEKQEKDIMKVDVADSSDSSNSSLPEISSLILASPLPTGSQSVSEISRISLATGRPAGGNEGDPGNAPGLAGISGVAGIGGGAHDGSLLSKFRAMPPKKRIIWIVCIGAILWMLGNQEEELAGTKKGRSPASRPSPSVSGGPALAGGLTFDRLSSEQQKHVETKYGLAFDYYKNQEFDKSLFELDQIFLLVNDYKNSRELERYARDGKRRLETQEEEKKRKEEEVRQKARVAEVVEQIRAFMDKKQYDKARELFPEVLTTDPENPDVAAWRKQIEEFEEKREMAEKQRQARGEIMKQAWGVFAQAKAEHKAGKYRAALLSLQQIEEMGIGDRKLDAARTRLARQARAAIAALRDPVLQEARGAEEQGDMAKAYQLYRKATQIDPHHKEGFAGMSRLKNILHEKAKGIYIEAVMAESYSDFETAKKKFKECLDAAPRDDIYFERAERKLARFLKAQEGGAR